VSEPEALNTVAVFTSMAPIAEGALLTWYPETAASLSTPWMTRAVGFDGAPRSSITMYPSFSLELSNEDLVPSLAANGCTFAGVVGEKLDGCRLLRLDQDGAELDTPTSVTSKGLCANLAPSGKGFSFLSFPDTIDPPFELVTVDATGNVDASVQLPGLGGYGGRYVLRDQSFLAVNGGDLSPRLRHFARDGTPLAAAVDVTSATHASVSLAETKSGVLAAWEDSDQTILVQLLDEDGHPTAPAISLAASGVGRPNYLTVAPAPNGDVVLAWFELDAPTKSFRLFVMALGPDATPRGAPTFLGTFDQVSPPQVLVEPTGARALLVFSGSPDQPTRVVSTVPLACSP
jgi:hypothetical protein